MANKQADISAEMRPDSAKRNVWSIIVLIFCVIVSMPVLFEVTLVCYGRWMEAIARPVDVRTPILNKISDMVETASYQASNSVGSFFDHAVVDPSALLLGAVVVLAVGGLLLIRW